MFTKRKPIILGETYIFDVFGESDMSQTTTLVTVIKKAKRRKTYIVMSESTKEVFECPQELLTPYSENIKVVRCEYGTTDFNEADLEHLSNIVHVINLLKGVSNIMKEAAPDDEDTIKESKNFDEIAETLMKYNAVLTSKVKRYYDIAQYKYNLRERILKSKLEKEKPQETQEEDKTSKEELAAERRRREFTDRFDAACECFHRGTIGFSEFLSTASDIISECFPIEDVIKHTGRDAKYISSEDLNFILFKAKSIIQRENCTVFLAARNPEGEILVLSITRRDIGDINFVDKYYNYVKALYPDWPADSVRYETKRRIITINVAISED